MYTNNSVNSELRDTTELPDNDFVGILFHGNLEQSHAGLVISFDEHLYVFHYDATDVILQELSPVKYSFIVKLLPIIRKDEVEAFLAHCKRISKTAKPKYGFFYAGSFYNEEGKYFSELGIEEYMTCVGFCINVVQGFIEEDYILYREWTEDTKANADSYFERFVEQANAGRDDKINEELYRKNLRRITPAEYTTSGFYTSLPISKSDVDTIVELVKECLKQKLVAIQATVSQPRSDTTS